MRDPNRIPRMLEALHIAWENNPDWRLGQLVKNAAVLQTQNWQVNTVGLEDDVMERGLQGLVKQAGAAMKETNAGKDSTT